MTVSPVAASGLRVAEVSARIEAACARSGRDPASVTLIAATKTRPASDVVDAYRAGIRHFGENYVQEGAAKFAEAATLLGSPAAAPFTRHFIGHLQRNKVNAAADAFDVFHGIDSARQLEALGHRATRKLQVFLQVNLAGEASKAGAAPSQVDALVARARQLNLVVLGLMTIPPPAPPEATRPWFRQLRELARANGLPDLSMGMTGDFEVAIEEGATHVRVGRGLFGERPR